MSKLFSSISLRGLTLPNRIIVSPMCQYSAIDGRAQSWHLAHLGSLAVSGAGMLIIEATAVEAIGRICLSSSFVMFRQITVVPFRESVRVVGDRGEDSPKATGCWPSQTHVEEPVLNTHINHCNSGR